MLDLPFDLETMYGLPDGLVDKGVLIRRFGPAAVGAACTSGLVRHITHPCRPAGKPCQTLMGLTSRGRMIAGCRTGQVYPFNLAAEPHEIVAAVLNGGQA